MSRVFKKSIVRYLSRDGKQVPKGTPGAKKTKEKSTKWYGRVPGSPRAIPLSTNKSAAQIMLSELVKKAEMAKAGVIDPFEKHTRRTLHEHLADFVRKLETDNNHPRYIAIAGSRLRRLFQSCGFVFLTDVDASKIAEQLAQLRRDRPVATLPADQEWFRPSEAADILKVKVSTVRSLVRHHRLAVEGRTINRRLPRATMEALQDQLRRGVNVTTTNQYLGHAKAFFRWLVKERRIPLNPIAHLEAGNSQLDRRHDRRELTEEELRHVLEVARASTQIYRGLTGQDRFHLYATACGTGYRASGLASLTPESFDLNADLPTVTLAARRNKSRVTKVQPLPRDVAELLRNYLRDKPPGLPVWGGTWAKYGKGSEMLRIDLDGAGIPYVVEGSDGPLFADFHALRHTYLTLAGRAGIDLRTLQELAGHSTPTLTARYSHRRLYDLAGAVEKLPNFLPADSSCPPVAQRDATELETVIETERAKKVKARRRHLS
jgi:integrase